MIYLYIELVLFALLLVCAPEMLWRDFHTVMNIMRVRDLHAQGKGPAPQKWVYLLGKYTLFRGYLLDAFVNIIHLSFILKERPRFPKWSRRKQYKNLTAWFLKDGELTVSERLQRHIDTPDSPHRELCAYLQWYWLSAYDASGKHGDPTALQPINRS